MRARISCPVPFSTSEACYHSGGIVLAKHACFALIPGLLSRFGRITPGTFPDGFEPLDFTHSRNRYLEVTGERGQVTRDRLHGTGYSMTGSSYAEEKELSRAIFTLSARYNCVYEPS
jgi:hypothetical protein